MFGKFNEVLKYLLQNSICCIAMDEDNYSKIDVANEKPDGIGYKFTLTVFSSCVFVNSRNL